MIAWQWRSGRLLPALLVALIALAGCSMNVPVNPQITAERSTKIERFIGVYISEETRETNWAESRHGDTWKFSLGPASARAIENAASRTFRRTTVVDGLPPLVSGASDVDAVLEARIEDFGFAIPLLKTSTYTADIAYRLTLYARNGVPVASWRLEGSGAQRGKMGFEYTRWPGEAANLAIEDAMRKFIEETDKNPEVSKWLRDSG
ncbi:MAG TPA: hypothetical protein VLA52_17905 [Thermohalobaculum sp.]|nr:hypothetical protein [Thermohalobaculum sp.]